jgi:hypothetical protein
MSIHRRKFLTTLGIGLSTSALATPFSIDEKEELKTEFVFKAEVLVDKIMDLGATQHGNRRIIPITGGTFEGPLIKGIIVPGGADWQIIRADGVAELEARYTLRSDDGALIYVINKGYRHGPPEAMQRLAKGEQVDPKEYYFRATLTFETSVAKYTWLTKNVFVATGERKPNSVILDFYKIL